MFVVKEKDPLEEYRQKEPMTPAKVKEHEPTAVHREMTEKITEGGEEVPNPEAAKEWARRSGMVKKELLVLLKLVMNMKNVLLNQTNR